MNVAEATAVMQALEWLAAESGRTYGEVLVLGDSRLVVDFCAHRARPKLRLLALAIERISELRRAWRGRWVFRHVNRE